MTDRRNLYQTGHTVLSSIVLLGATPTPLYMTLQVSRVNEPWVITDELFPLLQRYGEISRDDFRGLLNEHHQKSYLEHYQGLGEALSLFSVRDQTIVYQPDAFVVPTSQDPLSFLLFQFPHFRRYIRARLLGESLGPTDVLTPEERQYGYILDWRYKMLENWEDYLQSRVDDIESFVESNDTVPVQVKDGFFQSGDISPQKNGERALLLAIIVAGQEISAGVRIDLLEEYFEESTPETIIQEVFLPIGCEIDRNAKTGLLGVPMTLGITNPDLLEYAIEKAFGSVIDVRAARGRTLQSELVSCTPSQVYDTVGNIENRATLRLEKTQRSSSIAALMDLNLGDSIELKQSDKRPSHYEAELIPTLWGNEIPGNLRSNIMTLIESPGTGAQYGDDFWPLNILFRQHYSISTCSPLLTPSGTQLSELGDQIREREPEDQLPLILLLTYLHNFPVRFLATAAISGEVSVVRQDGTWKLRRNRSEAGLLEVMAEATDVTLLYPEDTNQAEIVQGLTKFCTKFEIIRVNQTKGALDMVSGFRETLSEYGRLDANDTMESVIANAFEEMIG